MGGCNSGVSKDTEIDLFLKRHHKLGEVETDKSCYEVSQQQWDPKKVLMILQMQGDQLAIEDEVELRQREKNMVYSE